MISCSFELLPTLCICCGHAPGQISVKAESLRWPILNCALTEQVSKTCGRFERLLKVVGTIPTGVSDTPVLSTGLFEFWRISLTPFCDVVTCQVISTGVFV